MNIITNKNSCKFSMKDYPEKKGRIKKAMTNQTNTHRDKDCVL